jgi:hypothetical protein
MKLLWALLVLVLLWLWLSGHWFGRGLMLTALAGFGIFLLVAAQREGPQVLGGLMILGSWPIASVPQWIWRRLQGPDDWRGRT